jgi:hypothetical protein
VSLSTILQDITRRLDLLIGLENMSTGEGLRLLLCK